MSSSRRKLVVRHPVVVDIGCSCRRPKLSSFFAFQAKPRSPKSPDDPLSTATTTSPTSSSHWETSCLTATTSSPPSTAAESPKRRRRSGKGGRRKRAGEGVAVVKESQDPYVDFKESMLVMIVEEEIHAWEDLRHLLHRFLALNAPAHHHLVLRAFADICASVFSPPSPARHAPRR